MKSTIEIILTSICNFACDYCISGSNHKQNFIIEDGKKRWVDIPDEYATVNGFPKIIEVSEDTDNDVYEDAFKNGYFTTNQALDARKLIYYIKRNLKGWRLVISGGEPLIYPGIDKLLKTLSKDNEIILLTNASQIQNHSELLANPNIFFRVGFHPEYRDLTEFFENITFMKSKTDNYIINYVHHPRHASKGTDVEYVNMLKEWDFSYEVSPFKGTYKDVTYNYDAGLFDENFLTEDYVNEYPEDEKLIPGESFLTMYGNGDVYACHRKKAYNGTLDSGNLSLMPSVDGLHCISEGTCHCDSMRAYNIIDKQTKT
jgi:organic radical activating enzyme